MKLDELGGVQGGMAIDTWSKIKHFMCKIENSLQYSCFPLFIHKEEVLKKNTFNLYFDIFTSPFFLKYIFLLDIEL